MTTDIPWIDLGFPAAINDKLSAFLDDLYAASKPQPHSVYLVGPAVRGELDLKRPNLQILIVADTYTTEVLDALAALGVKYGRMGFRAPVLLTPEYLKNANDVFPMQMLELSANHRCLRGTSLLENIAVDKEHLRLQAERELRLFKLSLRQGYLRAAGDAAWMNQWYLDSIEQVFALLRATLALLGGDPAAGNHDVAQRLTDKTGIDFSPCLTLWEHRRSGETLHKDQARPLYTTLNDLFTRLVEVVDALRK